MGIGRTNSGSGNYYAIIGISYPPGSTCTCTDSANKIVLRDKTRTGRWVCPVPRNGKWTIHATDGVNEIYHDVEINTKGQVIDINVKYELVLFENGDENVEVTGGWYRAFINSSESDMIKENGVITCIAKYVYNDSAGVGKSGGVIIGMNSPIDLTYLDNLVFVFDNFTQTPDPDDVAIGMNAAITYFITAEPSYVDSGVIKEGVIYIDRDATSYTMDNPYILDVSDVPDGSYYIWIKVESPPGDSCSAVDVESVKAKYEYGTIVADLLPETKSALQLVYDSLDEESQDQVIAIEDVKELFDRYGVDYTDE